MPQHLHFAQGTANSSGNVATPGNALLASLGSTVYGPPGSLVALDPSTITNVGGSQAHQNMQPFLTLNFCMALIGIFPSHN
jgi:microcystin-dependent protein